VSTKINNYNDAANTTHEKTRYSNKNENAMQIDNQAKANSKSHFLSIIAGFHVFSHRVTSEKKVSGQNK
jgi:hypothetical protein